MIVLGLMIVLGRVLYCFRLCVITKQQKMIVLGHVL